MQLQWMLADWQNFFMGRTCNWTIYACPFTAGLLVPGPDLGRLVVSGIIRWRGLLFLIAHCISLGLVRVVWVPNFVNLQLRQQ